MAKLLQVSLSTIATAILLLCAGCAQNALNAADKDQGAVPATASASSPTEQSVAAAAAEYEPDYENMNPVPLAFDKMSVKLNDADKKILAKLTQRAKKARKLVITAYCDRHQVGNARAAALARGYAVKQELIHLGAKANTIQLKIITGVADKHAAEIQFS